MPFAWKIGAFGLGALAIGIIVFLGYKHYTNIIEENKTLTVNNQKLEQGIELQNEIIEKQIDSIKEWQAYRRSLFQVLEDIRQSQIESKQETKRLSKLFSEHNFENLTNKKPGLIERRINRGTDRIFSLLECASGNISEDCPSGDTEAPKNNSAGRGTDNPSGS
jgi:regulator of replication initiation timing